MTFSHLAILVRDLDVSAGWYSEVLGWQESWRLRFDDGSLGDANGFSGAAGEVVMGTIGGVQVELVCMDTDVPPRPAVRSTGLMLASVKVPDLQAVRDACARRGTAVVREVPIGGTLCVVLADPDGTELAVMSA